jgi:DNA-binding transcriptional LysR family regulator
VVGECVGDEGAVRVTGTEGILSCWLVPRLHGFREDYPAIKIELLVADKPLNLGAREADIALRFGEPTDPRLMARELGTVRFGLFAARGYLKRHGRPASVDELYQHAILNHAGYYESDSEGSWRALIDGHPQPPIDTNSAIAYLHAVRLGLGIGMLPLYVGAVAPELVSLDLNVGYARSLFLVTHCETDKRARIQALSTYIQSLARQGLDHWFM